MTETTHLCLVSGQPTPNLTPLLDSTIAPRRVILLVSPDMLERATWLEEILKPRGIKVEHWKIDNAWDIDHIQMKVLEMLEREVNDLDIALNATGGTKPMSIACYEAFRAYKLPIYYVHPEEGQLIWLHPQGRKNHCLADRIRIGDFIRAHGRKELRRGSLHVPPEHRDFAAILIEEIDYFSGALGVLNWYAHGAADNGRTEELDKKHERHDAFQDLLDRLSHINLLKVKNGCIVFRDEAARFFANGGWLEQYVFTQVNSLKKALPSIQDTAQSVELATPDGASRNELDVVFLANNRLFLVECKARNFKRGSANSGAEAIYKLDSLAETIGGLQARAMLISYRALSPHDLQRARDLRIQVLAGKQLQNLSQHLKRWIAS